MENGHRDIKAIENGTVLDHIPSAALPKIISVLRLYDLPASLDGFPVSWTMGSNFESKKVPGEFKAFIKVMNYYFRKEELDLASLFAPDATVNIIKSWAVAEKRKIEVPARVEKVIKCENPTCITNKPGEPFETSFAVSVEKNAAVLTCKYCQRNTTQIHLR